MYAGDHTTVCLLRVAAGHRSDLATSSSLDNATCPQCTDRAARIMAQQEQHDAAARTSPAAAATVAPLDVDGRPIRVGALVECVGAPTGVLTGRRGRVTEASVESEGPGRGVLAWPGRPNASTTARNANRVRLVDPAELHPATIGAGETVHAYDYGISEAGCGYRNTAEPRVVKLLPVETPVTCTEPGCTRISFYDHNDECIGCGEHFTDPHGGNCPVETEQITAAVVLGVLVTPLQ